MQVADCLFAYSDMTQRVRRSPFLSAIKQLESKQTLLQQLFRKKILWGALDMNFQDPKLEPIFLSKCIALARHG